MRWLTLWNLAALRVFSRMERFDSGRLAGAAADFLG